MSLIGILSSFSLKDITDRADDDLVDRLNHDVTTLVLVALAIIISTKNYVGDQIMCWAPGYFPDAYVDYTNKACWVTNTYYLPFDETMPQPADDVDHRRINYYQWVHIFLLLQAVLFYTPCVVWKALGGGAGVSINGLIRAAREVDDLGQRERLMDYMARQLQRYLGHYRSRKHGRFDRLKVAVGRHCRAICGKKHGNYLTVLYFAVKVLYLINAFGQLFLMNAFLSTDFHLYGIIVLRKLATFSEWPESVRFPRVTICDFEVRQLGNVHRHTVQCVLPVNFFNERIYLFLWFWVVLVLFVTAVSVVMWLYRIGFEPERLQYVKLHLQTMNVYQKTAGRKQLCVDFVSKYLRQDGVFIVRLIGLNSDDIVASELLARLWEDFLDMEREKTASAVTGEEVL